MRKKWVEFVHSHILQAYSHRHSWIYVCCMRASGLHQQRFNIYYLPEEERANINCLNNYTLIAILKT